MSKKEKKLKDLWTYQSCFIRWKSWKKRISKDPRTQFQCSNLTFLPSTSVRFQAEKNFSFKSMRKDSTTSISLQKSYRMSKFSKRPLSQDLWNGTTITSTIWRTSLTKLSARGTMTLLRRSNLFLKQAVWSILALIRDFRWISHSRSHLNMNRIRFFWGVMQLGFLRSRI